jgi:hypothetical protein
MRTSHPPLAALVLLALPTAAGERGTGATPFRLETSPQGTLVALQLAVRAELEEAHALGRPIVVPAFPRPGLAPVELRLRPVETRAAAARIVGVDGREARLEPAVCCFSGSIPGGQAFLGLTADGFQGFLSDAQGTWTLGPGPDPTRASLVRLEAGALDLTCAAREGDSTASGPRSPNAPGGGLERVVAGPVLSTANVFIEVDQPLWARFATDQECVDYCAILVTAASEIYRRDLGVVLNVPDGFLRVWKQTPPWGAITALNQLDDFYGWWMSAANPDQHLERAAVHLFTSPVFGGTARGSGGVCDDRRAYEISSLNGRFVHPTQHSARENWDLFVVAHEFGHTFGSPHTSSYKPPIECQDGSGPDSGTLMSYCHQQFGVAGIGMRFHARVQERMRAVLEQRPCLARRVLERGDYDGNGRLDTADLAAADAVLQQGFRSAGAEEVLDLDADGDFDRSDRDQLASLVAPAASTVRLRNGTGLNPLCYQPLSAPFLGGEWSAAVEAADVGRMTWVVACLQPLWGRITPRGELLVRTPAEGGVLLLDSAALSDGSRALHHVRLPADPILAGRRVATQALVLDGSDGAHFCNALDLTLAVP